MPPRRFRPFKRPKGSPFDHDGPNQKARKEVLDWMATHDPNAPFAPPIQEVRKPVLTPPEPPPEAPKDENLPVEPVQTATESAKPARDSVKPAPPASEPTKQQEVSGASLAPSEAGSTHRDDKITETPAPPRSEPSALSGRDREIEDFAAYIRSFLRRPQRPSINSRRIRRIPRDDDDPANISRHRRLCVICRHQDRYAIEQAFLEWRRPSDIKREFDLPASSCIFRHARATGLFEKRARNLRSGLEKVIEESTCRPPSADSIIRAVRVYGCLDSNGRWVEPPRNLIITHNTVREAHPEPALPARASDGSASPGKRLISVDSVIIDDKKEA